MEGLRMYAVRDLVHRLRCHQAERRIAQDLGIARTTVRRYRACAEEHGLLHPDFPLPDDAALRQILALGPRPPRIPSTVEPFTEVVSKLLDQGVEMVALWQRLSQDHGFTGSYSSVRRFVHRLRPAEPHIVVRVHTPPGEEAQVDYGSVGRLVDPRTGEARTAYAFVATLCYSRHQYAELVFDQKAPTWIALHRRAFESWGGFPLRIVPDNLKAAVKQALVLDPVLGEAYRRMAQHYGFLVSPTRPATPEHKGKVESGIHYIERNFMAGQQFADITVANERLRTWVLEQAGLRIHGTTHQRPLRIFDEVERSALQPLPPSPFTLCEIKPVKVHVDCHVTIDGSYYSVPYPLVGRVLHAHVGEQVVQLFNDTDLVVTHERATEKGQWMTRTEHYPSQKAAYLQRTHSVCREIAAKIGPATYQVIDQALSERPLDRLRYAQAVLKLEESVGPVRVEATCARGLFFGDTRYRTLKHILNTALDQEPLPGTTPELPLRSFTFARPSREFFAVEEVEAP